MAPKQSIKYAMAEIKYATPPVWSYQQFDPENVKFTNIPLTTRKLGKDKDSGDGESGSTTDSAEGSQKKSSEGDESTQGTAATDENPGEDVKAEEEKGDGKEEGKDEEGEKVDEKVEQKAEEEREERGAERGADSAEEKVEDGAGEKVGEKTEEKAEEQDKEAIEEKGIVPPITKPSIVTDIFDRRRNREHSIGRDP